MFTEIERERERERGMHIDFHFAKPTKNFFNVLIYSKRSNGMFIKSRITFMLYVFIL